MHVRTRLCGLASFAIFIGCAITAQAIQIEAIQDTWIRESAADTDYNDDLISVWDGTNDRRHGVVLFDLTDTIGLTIDSVFLELFDRDEGGNGRSETTAIVQEAYLLSATPPEPDRINSPYTWTEYTTFDQTNESLLDSLGHYNIAAGDTLNGYEASDLASASDITALLSARDNNSNIVAFVFKAASGERDWGDIEFDGTPPRLVFNESVGVFGDFTGDGFITTADFDVIVDPTNWLQTVPAGTRGDMTGDGFVSLADFKTFKPIFLTNNPAGSLNFAAPVPEPASLTFFALAALGLAGWSRRSQHLSRNDILRGPMMKKLSIALFLTTLCVSSMASAVTVTESYDSWIRDEGLTLGARDGDWLGVYNDSAGGGAPRWTVLEFDLSSVGPLTVTELQMGFWHMFPGSPIGSSDGDPSSQTVAMISEIGATTAMPDFTWTQLNDPGQVTLTDFDSLGAVDLVGLTADPSEANKYHFGTASAADIALVQSLVNSGGMLRVVVRSDESVPTNLRVDWGDGSNDGDASHGESAILLINETPPEIVELTLQVNATTGAMKIINPGTDVAVDTMFDLDGYTIASPDGSLNPGGFTGLVGEGKAGWQIVAPTANALSEVNLSMATLFSEGDELPLGTGYMPGATEDAALLFQYSVAGSSDVVMGNVEYVTSIAVPGDYNGDAIVNAADYTIWRDTLGSTSDLRANGDDTGASMGVVDAADYVFWKTRFGNTSGSGSLTTSDVPEPTAGVLIGLLMALGMCWQRRARISHALAC